MGHKWIYSNGYLTAANITSAYIAKDFIKEIISELKDDLVYAQSRIEYFENVKNEIDAL